MKHAYTPMIEIDKSDTIVAGVSPAKVKELQPARLPLHLITESLLRAAYRAHPRFRRLDRGRVRCEASIVFRPELFVYDLDLLVDHLPGEAIDRHVNPVTLFAFHEETCESGSVERIAPALSDHVNH